MPQVVSANRLTDGVVVFLAPGGAWAERLAGAAVFTDKPALENGLAQARDAAARNLVVDIAAVDVETTPRGLLPKHIRDRIRAAGPTVHLDHGKQAAGG